MSMIDRLMNGLMMGQPSPFDKNLPPEVAASIGNQRLNSMAAAMMQAAEQGMGPMTAFGQANAVADQAKSEAINNYVKQQQLLSNIQKKEAQDAADAKIRDFLSGDEGQSLIKQMGGDISANLLMNMPPEAAAKYLLDAQENRRQEAARERTARNGQFAPSDLERKASFIARALNIPLGEATQMAMKGSRDQFISETAGKLIGNIQYSSDPQGAFKAAQALADQIFGAQGAPTSTPTAAPAAPGATQQYREGQTATGPGGKKIVFKGGKWVNQ